MAARPLAMVASCVLPPDVSPDFARRLVDAQPRYRSKAEPALVTPLPDGKLRLEFQRPQRAIAPGQVCAFYDGGMLLGGGVFEAVS